MVPLEIATDGLIKSGGFNTLVVASRGLLTIIVAVKKFTRFFNKTRSDVKGIRGRSGNR